MTIVVRFTKREAATILHAAHNSVGAIPDALDVFNGDEKNIAACHRAMKKLRNALPLSRERRQRDK